MFRKMATTWMIYGAYGYSGSLITTEAVRRGMKPIIAGRNREKTEALGRACDLEIRTAESDGIGSIMDGVDVLLNCAGPFERTWETAVDACLRSKAHYLDITGEIEVFEGIHARNQEARDAGVSLIPGVGFDVVPTDCLAAKLADALPDATHLELAFFQKGGGLSRGTLKTVVAGLGRGGAIRSDGRITEVPVAALDRQIPFSIGERTSMSIPWGDVSTAYHTTGIPNIVVYQGVHPDRLKKLRRYRPVLSVAGLPPIRWVLEKIADRHQGPDSDSRSSARMHLWGEARSGDSVATMTIDTPEGYELTASAAVQAVHRVIEGGIDAGALTPAKAFGHHFIDELEGVELGPISVDSVEAD